MFHEPISDSPFSTSSMVPPLVLERLHFKVQREFRHDVANSLDVQARVIDDRFGRRLAYMITGFVYAERLPPVSVTKEQRVSGSTVVELPMPATWWDHWKLTHVGRWWARWLVQRRPPTILWKQETVTFVRDVALTVDLQQYRSYPDSDVAAGDLGRPVYTHELRHNWRGTD